METIAITPERKAQLENYASRHGQNVADAVDEVLAACFDEERQEYQEAVEGVRRGYADFQAGRSQPAEAVFEDLRRKHDLPR